MYRRDLRWHHRHSLHSLRARGCLVDHRKGILGRPRGLWQGPRDRLWQRTREVSTGSSHHEDVGLRNLVCIRLSSTGQ